jgi:hypothetical protein
MNRVNENIFLILWYFLLVVAVILFCINTDAETCLLMNADVQILVLMQIRTTKIFTRF